MASILASSPTPLVHADPLNQPGPKPAGQVTPTLANDGSADGQHTVTVYETSAAGLSSAYASLAFTLDTHLAMGSGHTS
ncbi:hypothetical protein [Methylobacterium sp. GXS13]|uniref:hypothetical protein n=1 Tax=Methylobacterium sp. GXS13 TaxID=1730094 RepID=UPI000B1389AC|nr:hypothetical protein [Methylobacterium sp. GXS13]